MVSSFIADMNEIILSAADSPWIYVALLVLCIVDGFFPPVPSESLVVALAATAIAAGVPNIWLILVLAAAGAVMGDNIAYAIGRVLGTTRFRWMHLPRVVRTFSWARKALDTRGGVLIMAARYIPGGRVAVNMAAGASGFRHKRFFTLTVIAGASWALYSVAIGVLAGHWVHDNPILAVVIAVTVATVIGLAVDWVRQRVTARRATEPEADPRSNPH